MSIDGDRPSDRKIRVGLHDFDGEIGRVDPLLNLTPTGSRLYRDRFLQRREVNNSVVPAHVDMQRAFGRDLATHAVTRPTDGDRTCRMLDCRYDLFCRTRRDHAADKDRVELRYVVH